MVEESGRGPLVEETEGARGSAAFGAPAGSGGGGAVGGELGTRCEPEGGRGGESEAQAERPWDPLIESCDAAAPCETGVGREERRHLWGDPTSRTHARRLVKPAAAAPKGRLGPEQKLLILDAWRRSGLPAGDFAPLVGLTKHTLYGWKQRFEQLGPAGLMGRPKGDNGNRLPEVTRRTILMLKEAHPDWGCQRITDMLLRGPALSASPSAVGRVLHESGYELEETPTRPHPDKPRRFERAKPNELWQSDLFTFVLKRQNRRVYLVAFMDDSSRFIVSYGLHASQSASLVIECLRVGIASFGAPQETLTDNGSQYITWRGKSAFAKELERRGIRHVVASPRHPQTLGKIERFWGSLWRECVGAAIFVDLSDASRRIGHYIDYYNFQRPHQGLDGLVPAERFFEMAPQVRKTLEERVAANAIDLARQGIPKKPFFLTGRVGEKSFSVHAEGERVILTKEGSAREEIDLTVPEPAIPMPEPLCPQGVVGEMFEETEGDLAPGSSPLDEGLKGIDEQLHNRGGES